MQELTEEKINFTTKTQRTRRLKRKGSLEICSLCLWVFGGLCSFCELPFDCTRPLHSNLRVLCVFVVKSNLCLLCVSVMNFVCSPHIRNRPKRVSGMGAFKAEELNSPSTSRMSRVSIIPSSQRRTRA